MTTILPSIAILSLGEMGAGIAKLLTAHSYPVLSNLSGRSAASVKRAKDANVKIVESDQEMVIGADYFLSIVPPGDAVATAKRVVESYSSDSVGQKDGNGNGNEQGKKLIYIDLNAIAPSTAREINKILTSSGKPIIHVDGGIIGGPPSLSSTTSQWKKPSLAVSGPYDISSTPEGSKLATLLNLRHIHTEIGPASGLKCCYASMTKGFTAIAIQSLTTASRLGVLDELEHELGGPGSAARDRAFGSVSRMQSKAYRWVREMEEIAKAFEEDGGFIFPSSEPSSSSSSSTPPTSTSTSTQASGGNKDGEKKVDNMFIGASKVYNFVAEDEVLGHIAEDGTRAKSTDQKKTVEELAGAIDRMNGKRKS